MARPQYASDHRRWFRVMEDVLDDPGYRGLSAADKVAWIDLLAVFNRQQAHRSGNCIVLPWSRAMLAMSSQNRRAASARASRLARGVGVSFARTADGLLCYIPKWSKMQGLTPTGLRPSSVVTPRTTTTPTTTPTPSSKSDIAPKGKKSITATMAPINGEPATPRSKAKKPPKESKIATDLAWHFVHELETHLTHFNPPTKIDRWSNTLRLMIDGTPDVRAIPIEDIRKVIDWCVRDDFEKNNVQCPDKLRKRFAQLFSRSNAPPRKTPTTPGRKITGWKHG